MFRPFLPNLTRFHTLCGIKSRAIGHHYQQKKNGCRLFFSISNPNSLVKHHTDTKIVPFSPEEMFDVVADVDQYKNFVPFCMDSQVLRRPNENVMEARLKIGFHIFTESYTSRVIMKRPEKIVIKSIESPTFKRIESEWVFCPVESNPNACQVIFKATFEVASLLHSHAIQLFFDDVALSQLNAFISRARKVHSTKKLLNPVQTPPTPPAKEVATIIKESICSQDVQQNLAYIFKKYAEASDQMYFSGFTRACRELAKQYDEFKWINDDSALGGAIFTSFGTSQHSKDYLNQDEFTVGVHLMTKGTVEEKAHSLFLAIDSEGDGKISREELTRAMQRRIRTVKKIFPKLLREQVKLQAAVTTSTGASMALGITRNHGNSSTRNNNSDRNSRTSKSLSLDDGEDVCLLDIAVDDAICKGLKAIEIIMKDIEKDIPLAVNQIFLEADLDQDDYITEEEWLFAWQAHPEFVELMTVEGMKKVAQWAAVVHPEDDSNKSEEEKHALNTRLIHVD